MKRMDGQLSTPTPSTPTGVENIDDIEAEVARARLSFEQGLREASRAGTRAARRVVTPALLGVGLAGGALLLLALARLGRRPAGDGALIRIVIETPRTPKRLLPAVGVAVGHWLLQRQLRSGGPLAALLAAIADPRAARGRGMRANESNPGFRRYES